MHLTNALLLGSLLIMASFGTYNAGMAYQRAIETTKQSLGGH